MLRTAYRNLAAHKLRLLTTGLAVMLAVAFMAGTLVLGDTIQKTFDSLFTNIFEGTDAVVREKAAFSDPNGFGDLRGRVDESLVPTVAAVPGVAVAEGGVLGYAQLVDKEGETVGNPQAGPPVLGGDWPRAEQLNNWTLVAGQGPQADDEVVIDKNSADKTGYQVGDTAQVLVKGGPQTVRISGIVKLGNADSVAGASIVLFPVGVAQRLVAEPGKFDTISVVADKGVSQGEVVERIQPVLADGVEAVTGAAVTKENQDAFRKGFSFFNTFMLVFAVIALLVGGFMIFNTFFITVAQRTRENALMRALGASKRQILASVVIEAAAVGVIASVIGLFGGVAVTLALKALLTALGFDLQTGGVVVTASTVVISLVAGIGITLVAAISPARKAGKVPPVAAMRDVAVGSTGYGSKQRIMVGSAILVLGIGSLLFGLFGGPSNPLLIVGVGALLVFFGVSVLGRTVALPLSRVIGWPIARLRGITGRLARENAMRNPKRTAATASALMIGVGLVSFITIFAASAKASFSNTVDKVFTGDFVITSSAGFGSGGIDPGLAERLNTIPEVERAGALRAGLAQIDGSTKSVYGVNRPAFDLIDVEPVAGTPDDLDASAIAVSEKTAKDKDLAVGDEVNALFKDSGPQRLRVAMIFANADMLGDWVLGLPAYEANFRDQYDYQVFVQKAPGVSTEAALAAVQREAAAYPGTDVLDQTEYKADQMQAVDQLLGLVYALLGLAVFIALLGIGNTLALSILERTRELGVMRAVGMHRRQLRSMIRWESVILALQGTLLGLLVGVFFGWALVSAVKDEGIGINTFQAPIGSLLVVVVLGGIAGVIAAVLPARRAARLNVLQAIVTE